MSILSRVYEKNPREASFFILNSYISQRNNLKNIINRQLKSSQYTPTDRRFINEIVRGTIRYLLKIDYLISLFSRIKIENIDLQVLNILRTATYQFLFMSRVPEYSIVDESVKIAKKYTGLPASRFINALLRKIGSVENLSDYTDVNIKKNIHDPIQELVLKYSFPEWLIDYWSSTYGISETEKLVSSLNTKPLNFLRINNLKTDKARLIELMMKNGMIPGEDFDELSGDRLKEKIFIDTIAMHSLQDIISIPGYSRGFFSIQDFSSQFVVRHILKPVAGEKILDICGAPGGKATYIAELTGDNCEIVSVDISENKLKIFRSNIERLGIKNIRIIKSDATSKNFINSNSYFDKILVDCPCSALGTISKNPDVKYNKTLEDIKRLSKQAQDILSNCRKNLKPGGRIIFYTCTLSKLENQDVISRFIEKNKDSFTVRQSILPGLFKSYLYQKGDYFDQNDVFLEIMPYYFNSEGGFIAEICSKKRNNGP